MKHSLIISKNALCRLISESIIRNTNNGIGKLPKLLYHKSPISCRKSILRGGLIPQIGPSYSSHYEGSGKELKPYIFLYSHEKAKNGEYDSTYDDDIYAIDTSQLDIYHLQNDPDKYMKGCFVYDLNIPTSAIKLIYKGSRKDSDDISLKRHDNIYEGVENGLEITVEDCEYGEKYVRASVNGSDAGYSILVIHRDIDSLISEISDTDSYEMAMEVVRVLDYNKPVIEIADVDVRKEYRNMGISKALLEYVLGNYKDCQFYMRVCPTDGVDERTLANSVIKYGFIEIDNDENGTFLVKK